MNDLTKISVIENMTAVTDLDCGTADNPDVGVDLCGEKKDGGKPVAITLSIAETLIADSGNDQDGKLDAGPVNGQDNDGTYFVTVTDKDGNETFFSGAVDAGQPFTAITNDDKFDSQTFINIYSGPGGQLLQTINLHTSCSAPQVIGDQYASVTLEGARLENGQVFTASSMEMFGEPDVVY